MGVKWVTAMPPEEVPSPYHYGFTYYIQNGLAWKNFVNLSEWCWEHYGDEGLRWGHDGMKFWFRDVEDAMEFKLRWV